MAKQPGRLLLIKIGDGEVSEAFNTLCGLTSKSMTLNNNSFDVTTADCAAPGGQLWGEVMTGVRTMSVSGNGLFSGGATETRLLDVAFGTGAADEASAICNFEIIFPGLGTFSGAFHVDSLEYGGDQEGGATYSMSLRSSGVVTFTALP